LQARRGPAPVARPVQGGNFHPEIPHPGLAQPWGFWGRPD